MSLDGTDFKLFEGFHCDSYYQTKDSLVDAIISCREDINCSMVTTTACYNGTDGYHLCDQTPELIPDVESCTYRKKGRLIDYKIEGESLQG